MSTDNTMTGIPIECPAYLSGDHLFSLRRAVDFVLSENKRLHWTIVALMDNGKGAAEQLKITKRLASESRQLEDAMSVVCRMFEAQFK